MTKEKRIKDMILRASEEESLYWYDFLKQLFSPYNNTKLPGSSAYNPKRNPNLTTYEDPGLLLKNEKKIVKNYFKDKIPDDKILIRCGLFEEKYLTLKIKIILNDQSTLTFSNEIFNGRDNHYFQMMKLQYSRMMNEIPLDCYTRYTFIFDKLIDVYNNYSNYLNEYRKTKKITEISKVSAEQLANKYFNDYELKIEGEKIFFSINYFDKIELKYTFTTKNLVQSFENIKNNFDKTLKFFTSFDGYNQIKIEKINRENEQHKGFLAKEEIQELLNNEIELRKKIQEYIYPKIQMNGKKAIISQENFVLRCFLEENNICSNPINAKEEMDKFKKIFKEVCNEEKEKRILELCSKN